MKRRLLLVRHDDGPSDDRVTVYCEQNGLIPDRRNPFAGDLLGDVSDDLAGMVVYGGIYNADDAGNHPFLDEEYRMMGAVIDAGLPLLGLCQGAQMIAHHLGAWAGAPDHGQHEFGLYEVTPTGDDPDFMPGPMFVCQWHFHTYDLPPGAVHLARGATFEQQAFRVGDTVYGLQFHPEKTVEGFRRWQARAGDTYGKPGVQTRAIQDDLIHQHDAAQAEWFYGFLARLFA